MAGLVELSLVGAISQAKRTPSGATRAGGEEQRNARDGRVQAAVSWAGGRFDGRCGLTWLLEGRRTATATSGVLWRAFAGRVGTYCGRPPTSGQEPSC